MDDLVGFLVMLLMVAGLLTIGAVFGVNAVESKCQEGKVFTIEGVPYKCFEMVVIKPEVLAEYGVKNND